MPLSRPFIIHLLYMLLGYALAVLVATTLVVFLMGLPTVLPDQGALGSFYRYLNDFPMMFLFGLMITSMYGLPGWLMTVIFAERRDRRGRWFFAVTGFCTALLALVFAGMGQGILSEPLLHGASLVGGICGGLAYWALAGKQSGSWKQTP